ncbi:hypothetical protein [Methanolobus sp.]|uniref:hypothetical protein n=1 Tax=Methanolobus sp. TaxID=1874737 RepID=UPI0025CD2949|nr:hypothetical protein [Methanolobus sp.]
MYTCIKDPETGKRLYADIVVGAPAVEKFRLEYAVARDVATEDQFVEDIIRELRGVKIRDRALLSAILKDAFGVSADECLELVQAVEERMMGRMPGVGI